MLPGILGLHSVTGASAAASSGGAPLIFGATSGTGNSGGLAGDLSGGSVYTCPANGTIDTLHITGHPSITRTGNFRLVIYAASSVTTPTNKLGETAATTGVAAATTMNLALLSPVAVTAGSLYWIGIHTGSGSPGCATTVPGPISVGGNRVFTDTFADGALSTAGATSAGAAADLIIWATGTNA